MDVTPDCSLMDDLLLSGRRFWSADGGGIEGTMLIEPSPPPTMMSPRGVMAVHSTPSRTCFSGPEFLNSRCPRLTCMMSPVLVPQYAYSSYASMAMVLVTRLSCPRCTRFLRSLRADASNSHTSRLRLPPVISLVLVVLKNFTVLTMSELVGEPHTGLPVSTSHTTRALSSCPPRDARYLESHEKLSAWTLTLCRPMRCRSVLFSRSQMMISAVKPM
mmetsp:Transcript_14770/g.47082  ORF Transcript_14770/g.47082 Transcript_14770/m.47082 type:complete len:217 (-) Transcript_14770:338-988(-)